jgi:hypothetical protein
LQGWIPSKSGFITKEAISKDFSMGVDIASTPAGNADRPFGKRSVLRGYFSPCLPVPESGLDPEWFCFKRDAAKEYPSQFDIIIFFSVIVPPDRSVTTIGRTPG